MEVALVIIQVLTPVDGIELEEAKTGPRCSRRVLAAKAGRTALDRLDGILHRMRLGLSGRPVINPGWARVRIGRARGQLQKHGRTTTRSSGCSCPGLLAQLAELVAQGTELLAQPEKLGRCGRHVGLAELLGEGPDFFSSSERKHRVYYRWFFY